MTEPLSPANSRRRWINLGEGVAVVGLLISGLALWNSWGRDDPKPVVAVADQPRAIPLALRGKVLDDGKGLAISPVESSHALDSLTLSVPGKPPLELGGDPVISAAVVEGLLPDGKKDGRGVLLVSFAARYIEAGTERRTASRYRLDYRWVNGGLFGGHSLRLTGMKRG